MSLIKHRNKIKTRVFKIDLHDCSSFHNDSSETFGGQREVEVPKAEFLSF